MSLDTRLNIDLEEYLLKNSSQENSLLHELRRKTYLSTLNPHMLSGPILGKFIEMLVSIYKPKSILEIGTFTGYTTLCMAMAVGAQGHITTIEINDEIAPIAQHYFEKSGFGNQIELLVGNALSILPELNSQFDFIFVDGDKREYPEYLQLAQKYLEIGGLLVADNVLWSGKVLDSSANDAHTLGVIKFNQLLANNNHFEKVMLPLRDGITLARRIS